MVSITKIRYNSQHLIEKINILLTMCSGHEAQELLNFRIHLENLEYPSSSDVNFYEDMEIKILEKQPSTLRNNTISRLKRIDAKYRNNFIIPEELISEDKIYSKINSLEKQISRLAERPRLYELRAEEMLKDVNEKFRSIMDLNEKNSNITDRIKEVKALEEKLNSLEADAQNMLSDISTVQLGHQYLDAKNRYSSPAPKMKFSRSPKKITRYFFNLYFAFSWLLKRIFHSGFFLYLGFITSLIILTFMYAIIIYTNNSSYKDLALTIPMLWLAWFFQRKINIREKLFEIYNHKQKVMETYVAFKNSIYTFNSEDKMEEVLLEAIKKDPSDCMGINNATLIEAILDKLRGLFASRQAVKAFRHEINKEQ